MSPAQQSTRRRTVGCVAALVLAAGGLVGPLAVPAAPAAAVEEVHPVTAGSVTVTGTPRVGQTLTAASADWEDGVSLAHQWLRGGTPIAAATGASYTAVAADLGARLSVRVTGSQAGRASSATTSAATEPVATGTLAAGVVRIAGAVRVGRTLQARPSGFGPGSAAAYRWLVGTRVVGTKRYLRVRRAMAGKRVVLQATVTKAGYQPVSVTSVPTGKVRPVGKRGRDRG